MVHGFEVVVVGRVVGIEGTVALEKLVTDGVVSNTATVVAGTVVGADLAKL
jgi:hypothetical protein